MVFLPLHQANHLDVSSLEQPLLPSQALILQTFQDHALASLHSDPNIHTPSQNSKSQWTWLRKDTTSRPLVQRPSFYLLENLLNQRQPTDQSSLNQSWDRTVLDAPAHPSPSSLRPGHPSSHHFLDHPTTPHSFAEPPNPGMCAHMFAYVCTYSYVCVPVSLPRAGEMGLIKKNLKSTSHVLCPARLIPPLPYFPMAHTDTGTGIFYS